MSEDHFDLNLFVKLYENFDNRSLAGKSSDVFFLSDLIEVPGAGIINTLDSSTRFTKFLIIGQGGCGLSTLINYLSDDEILNRKNHVARFSVLNFMNVMDVEPIDLIFFVYINLLMAMPLADIIPPFEDFEYLIGEVLENFNIRDTGENLIKTVFFKNKTDTDFRIALRQQLEKEKDTLQSYVDDCCSKFSRHTYDSYKITENSLELLKKEEVSENVLSKLAPIKDIEFRSELKFIRTIEERIGDIQTIHYKPVIIKYAWVDEPKDALIFIDDMDKLRWQSLAKIFSKGTQLLAGIKAKIVINFPLFACYLPFFSAIKEYYVTETLMPPYVLDPDEKPEIRSIEMLKKIVEKRMEPGIIDDDALDILIKDSGGLVGNLIYLVRNSLKTAIIRKSPVIDDKISKYVVKKRSEQTLRFFNFDDLGNILKKLIKKKSANGIDDQQLSYLLRYQFVLQYGLADGSVWYNANPGIKRELNKSNEYGKLSSLEGL